MKCSLEFDCSEWKKRGTTVISNSVIAPDGTLSPDNIAGKGLKDAYILQSVPYTKGTFTWSVWLKGNGKIRIRVQEEGGDYTNYAIYNIMLTPNWTRYSITSIKDDDGNGLRCVISNIETTDNFNLWGAELNNVSLQKIIVREFIVPKKDKILKIECSMFSNEIKNRFIGLKKDNDFSYISLTRQIKNVKNKNVTKPENIEFEKVNYSFKIPKAVLEWAL